MSTTVPCLFLVVNVWKRRTTPASFRLLHLGVVVTIAISRWPRLERSKPFAFVQATIEGCFDSRDLILLALHVATLELLLDHVSNPLNLVHFHKPQFKVPRPQGSHLCNNTHRYTVYASSCSASSIASSALLPNPTTTSSSSSTTAPSRSFQNLHLSILNTSSPKQTGLLPSLPPSHSFQILSPSYASLVLQNIQMLVLACKNHRAAAGI